MAKKKLQGLWVLEAFRRSGVDTDRLVRECPAELKNLIATPLTTSTQDLNTVLLCCARLSGDENFGLHMVDNVDVVMMGPMGYLQVNAPTVKYLMEFTTKFYHTLYLGASFHFTRGKKTSTIEFRLDMPLGVSARHQNEWSLAFLPDFITKQVGYRWQPLSAEFTNDAPDNINDLVEIFGSDISFNASRTAFNFETSILDLKINKTDPHLLKVLTNQAEAIMCEIGYKDPFISMIRFQILEGMESGSGGSADVAQRMAMSRSTLKRRLEDHGLTFRGFRDEVIREVASEALLDTDVDVGEVSSKLGYSELSAFDRAFKRLTGLSPTQFRDAKAKG